MATKAEYLTSLALRVYSILEVKEVGVAIGNNHVYDALCVIRTGSNTFNRQVQSFIVLAEGEVGEEALNRDQVISSYDTTFKDQLTAGIASFKASNPNVKRIVISEMNDLEKFAVFVLYTDLTGTVTKSMKFVYDDAGTLRVRDYVQ